MFLFGLDPLYFIMIIPVLLFSMWAQFRVKSSFNKYSRVRARSGLTGAQAAAVLMERYGLSGITIARAGGLLSDHYSPTQRKLSLSDKVGNAPSIAALGVAAHEVGHAVQHQKGLFIMRLWQALAVPVAFAGNAALWLIIIGAFLSLTLAKVGFVLFLGVVAFQILTLPLEFDASRRAKQMLLASGVITPEEKAGVAAVLNNAALTYVAAAAVSLTQLLYFALRLGIFGRR
ncbi:MAG TPA: zinc metallopeptidase [Spirochaetia bacterium]|nr:zinc metallopeptidase [Spirochaetia bacterium]